MIFENPELHTSRIYVYTTTSQTLHIQLCMWLHDRHQQVKLTARKTLMLRLNSCAFLWPKASVTASTNQTDVRFPFEP